MSFVTTVNCMDGRVQLPVINYLRERYGVPYVDSVTEAGPVRFLADEGESREAACILRRVGISVNTHGPKVVAIVAHADCAGNGVDDAAQKLQLERSVDLVAESYPGTTVVGLWLPEDWSIEEMFTRRVE